MKSSWKTVTLKEISENIQYGHTASANGEPIGPKFLRITDIVPDLIGWNSVPYCEIAEKDLGKYLLHDGDIVIARTGATTGYAKYIKGNQDSVFASYLVRVQLKPDVDKLFIGKIVESDIYKKFIRQNIGGSAQPNANAQILTSFPINLPPLSTQRKIAGILSAYDDLIENNTRCIKVLKEMAQRIYHEWFVYFRYPGHENHKLVESKLGLIPEEWEDKSLDQIMDFQGGAQPVRSQWSDELLDGYIRMIQIRDYQSDKYVCYVKDSEKLRKCLKNDVMIARYGASVGRICWGLEGAYNVALVKVIPRKKEYREFLRAFLQSERFQKLLIGMSGRAAQAGFNKSTLKSIRLAFTSKLNILQLYDQITTPMHVMILNLESTNSNLRLTRDLLLPQLISNKIDVSELDIDMVDE